MELKYVRKIGKSNGNKASTLTIPRAVAEAWRKFESAEMVWDGKSLKISPICEGAAY